MNVETVENYSKLLIEFCRSTTQNMYTYELDTRNKKNVSLQAKTVRFFGLARANNLFIIICGTVKWESPVLIRATKGNRKCKKC